MPRKRRMGKGRRGEVAPIAWAILTDQEIPEETRAGWTDAERWEYYILFYSPELRAAGGTRPALRDHWEAVRDTLLDEWTEARPGTRPSAWWTWDAPGYAEDRGRKRYLESPPEDQAGYLAQHGLLTTAERKALGMRGAA